MFVDKVSVLISGLQPCSVPFCSSLKLKTLIYESQKPNLENRLDRILLLFLQNHVQRFIESSMQKKMLVTLPPQNNSSTISLSVAITFLGRLLISQIHKGWRNQAKMTELGHPIPGCTPPCQKLSITRSSIQMYVT